MAGSEKPFGKFALHLPITLLCALFPMITTSNVGKILWAILPLLVLVSCARKTTAPLPQPAVAIAPVQIHATPLDAPQACSDKFIPHILDHTTTTDDGRIQMFEANGSGLATGDLDNDGDLDLVLGNLDFPNTVLWNEGNLHFRSEHFAGPKGNTRAITLVDVDVDGWLDIVLTRGTGEVNYWHNDILESGFSSLEMASNSSSKFKRETLPGINRLAYVMNWGDLDADGDLDLVTATYDAGLLTDRGNDYLLNGNGGVTLYQSTSAAQPLCNCTWDPRLPDALRESNAQPIPPGFQSKVLSTDSMALALDLIDLNGDQRLDILVGNDFEVRDQAWLNHLDGWQQVEPFATTTHSTMGFETGDINNDGADEIFASDMNPYDTSPRNLAEWLPVIADLQPDREADDPQIGQNVLHVAGSSGWRNEATAHGIDATGWSWSSAFGDLDNDGWLDFYVVNGMIEERMWAHLPNHELVEENQAFRNNSKGIFEGMPGWGLNATASGRSMVMADFDSDGDLDIAINNLRAAAQLFENQLCAGDALEIDLLQQGVQNRSGVGAQVKLSTSVGDLMRTVRLYSGYLSGETTRLHFGFPRQATITQLEIRWPDGAVSVVKDVERNSLLQIER